MYYGRRNGPRKDPSMHRSSLDPDQAVPAPRKAIHREMHYCVPIQPRQELGERTGYFTHLVLPRANFLFCLVKWLGKDAVSALAIDGKGTKAEMLERVARWVAANGRNVSQPGESMIWTLHKPLLYHCTVMIVSYETLRTLSVHLANCTIGLLLCDEGHRLKNSGE